MENGGRENKYPFQQTSCGEFFEFKGWFRIELFTGEQLKNNNYNES